MSAQSIRIFAENEQELVSQLLHNFAGTIPVAGTFISIYDITINIIWYSDTCRPAFAILRRGACMARRWQL